MKHRNSNITPFLYGPLCFGLLLFACLTISTASAQKTDSAEQADKNAEIILPISEKDDYKVESKDNKLIISFNRPFDGNLGKASKNLKNFVVSQNIDKDGKSITLTMNTPVSIKNRIKNGQLIISISKQKPAAKNKNANNKNIRLAYGNHEKFARFVFEYGKKPVYTVKNENNKTVVSFSDDINLQSESLKNYPDYKNIEKTANKQGGTDITIPEPLLQSFEYKNKLVLDFAKPEPQKKETQEEEIHKGTSISKSTLANAQGMPLPSKDEVASLSFSWNVPVGAAVFRRGEYIWVIFDHNRKIEIEKIRRQSEKVADEVLQIPHNKGTVLRFKPKKDVKIGLRQEGLLWIIDLYTHDVEYKIRELPVFIQYNSLRQAYLYVPTPNAGVIISVVDPEIGDTIMAAPNVELGVGINSDYKYPDLEILSSEQGLAIIPETSDIEFSRGNTGLSIKGYNRGLNISEDLENMKRRQSLGQDNLLGGFDLKVSPQLLKLNFNTAEDRLKSDIANAEPDKRTEARIQLAKYYIAKGLGTNALKILNALSSEKDPVAETEKFHALHGVANFLAERYDNAIDDFSYGKLPNQNEAVFWRTLAASALEFKKENNIVLFSFISVMKDYPQELKERIALVAADTAIQANDDIATQNFMDVLKSSQSSINRKAHIMYLNAKKSELQGYPRNALRQYGTVIPMNSQKYSSLARFEKTNLELKLKLISLDKAIAEFERLRYAWGEPKFKLTLLNKLAEVYAQNQDYYNALKTYQEALTVARPQQRQDIMDKMVRLFEEVYLNNRADDMPPLKALAMYQDFDWLAPRSPHYTSIVQKLADRLVAVDLLQRAADMLKEQLRLVNLEDIQKAQIGTRLALIYLFQSDNMSALDILDRTEMENMPENLSQYRKIIRAQALDSLGKHNDALQLLEDDTSKNALLLKSGIYWKNARWDKAADTIKYLIEKPVKDKPLSEEQINYILDWATALKKAGRETVIIRLRNKFLPYFAKTPYYSTFNVLTNNLEPDKIDLKAISQAVNDVAAYSNFSKLYNKTLRDTTLPKTVE